MKSDLIISIFSILSSCGFYFLLYLLSNNWDFRSHWNSGLLLTVSFGSLLFVSVANFLEWSGITPYFDVFEYPLEVMVPITLGFFPLAFYGEVTKMEERKAREREKHLHSLLTHNLKNKIQIIEGYLDLAREEKSEERIDRAREAIDETTDLIKRVRTLVRSIESGRQNQSLSPSEFKSGFDSLMESKKPLCEEKDIKMELEVEADGSYWPTVPIRADKLFFEALDNIIGNAVTHANCERIKIGCQETSDGFDIIVDDDGSGIPDDKKKKIFEPTYPGSGSGGLGLYLSSEIVDGYGGKISVHDSPLGGARFVLSLKKA